MKLINKESKVIIEEVGVCDFNNIGHWVDSYPTIKLGYYNESYKGKYSDIAYCIKNEKGIFGYFICHNIVNVEENSIIPLYSRKLVLEDMAIDDNAFVKFGIMLVDYLLKYATSNGYKAVEIKKINKNQFFVDFLLQHYKLKEYNDYLYFIIDNPIVVESEKYLMIYENDKIKIDDLYFLKSIGSEVLQDRVILNLTNNDKIIVDRTTGVIKFPKNVKILNDEVILNNFTRNIVHMIWKMYETCEVKNIEIDYKAENPIFYEIYEGNILYVNKSLQTLFDDIRYVLKMMSKGIEKIYPYLVFYDMNDNSFSESIGGIICDKLVERYALTCDSKAKGSMEIMNERKLCKKFNEKMLYINRFDYIYTSKGIKKKLSIVFSDVANIFKNDNPNQSIQKNKEDVIKSLQMMNFNNWKKVYDSTNSKPEKNWIIKLTFENEIIEYKGTDNYPNIWVYVEWFINKYYN